MAIIGSAEVEVRADVRKLGKDITGSFKDLEKQADDIADRMGKSIADGIKDHLDGLTLQVGIDQEYFLDQARQVEDTMGVLSDEAVNIKVEVDADEILDLAVLLEDLSGTVQLDIDQDHFSRQVLFAEDTLGNLMDSEVPVTITADTDSLLKLADDVRNIVDSIPESSRTVKYEPKMAPGAQSAVNKDVSSVLDQARAAADNFNFEMSVDADIDEARATLEELQEKIEDEELEIGITYSKSDLEQLNGAIETLRQYNEANAIELEVDIHITKAMAKLALLARNRTMKILPEIGGSFISESSKMLAGMTGMNIMKEDFKSFIESLTQLDVKLKGLVTQLLLVSAAVPAVGWMSGWAVTLIGDLGTLSGLLVPLAGLLGGAAIGGGTLAIALMGTGDRLDDLVPKFESFRDVISNTYWGVAEAPLRNMIDKVLPPLQVELETTSKALGVMSTALFDAITNIATSPEGQGAFSTIIANTNIAIKKLGPAFEPFLRGLLNLSAIGSQYLPEISDWVVSIAEKFEEWTQNTEGITEWADNAIEVMKALFSIVGSTVGIMKTLYGVAQTAGFPGVRELATGLEDINKSMAKPANVEFLTNLATSVTTAMDSIVGGLDWVGPLIMKHADGIGKVIETMGRIIGKVFEGIGRMLTNTGLVEAFFGLFDSLESGVDTFHPVFEALGTIFEVTLNMLGSAIEYIAPVLAVFFQNLANDAELVKPALEGVLEIIGEWGPKVMKVVGVVTVAIAGFIGGLDPVLALLGLGFLALMPLITTVGSVLFTFGKGILNLTDDIARWSAMSGPVGAFFTSIRTAASGLGGWFAGIFTGIWTTISTTFSRMTGAAGTAVGKIGAFFAPIGTKISGAFGGIVGRISAIFAPVGPAVGGIFSKLVGNIGLLFQGLLIEIKALMGPSLTGVFSKVGGVIGGVFSKISGYITPLTGGLSKLGGSGFGALAAKVATSIPGIGFIISAFITAITVSEDLRKAIGEFLVKAFVAVAAMIEPLLSPLKSLFGVIMDVSTQIGVVLAPAFTSVFNILNSLMPVVILVGKVIGEVLGAAITLLVGAIKAAWAFIQPILSGAVTFVSSVFNGIAGIISGVIDVIVNLFTGDFAGAFESLKGIGDTVMEMLKGAFDGIVEMVIGVFEGLVGSVKESFTGMMEAVLGVLDGFGLGEAGQAIIQSLIDGFGAALDAVKKWLQDLTQKIIDWKGPPADDATLLNDAGSSIIQSLIDGFISAVDAVFTFLQNLTSDILNAILAPFQGMIDAIKPIWDQYGNIIRNAINAIIGIIRSVLGGITTIISNIWNGIIGVIQLVWERVKLVIHLALAAVKALISGNFTQFITIISTIWQVIITTIQQVWNRIKTIFLTALTSLWTVISTGFSNILNVIRVVLTAVWTFITSVWNVIWTTIVTIVTNIWLTISTTFNSILTTITVIVTAIWTWMVTTWNLIWTTIVTIVTNLWTSIVNTFNNIKLGITIIVTAVWTWLTATWNLIWTTIVTIVTNLWTSIVNTFNRIKLGITIIITAVWTWLTATWNLIWTTIVTIVTNLWNNVKALFNRIKLGITIIITAVWTWLTNTWNTIRSTIVNIVNNLRDRAVATFNNLKDRIISAVTNAKDRAVSMFNSLKDRVISAATSAKDRVVSAFNSLKDRLVSAVNSAKDRAVDAFNRIRDKLASAANAAKDKVVNAFQSLKDGAVRKINSLLDTIKGIPGKIKSALGNLGDLLTGAGKDIINGLISGVSGMIKPLRDKFSGITNMIPDWKGPPDTDAKLLTNAGELIMEGLISGLESKYGAVKDSLQGFTGDLSQTVKTNVGADIGLSTSVRRTALSDAERRLAYRSNANSVVESNRGIDREVHLHFHNALVNESEIITVVNRELGRGV